MSNYKNNCYECQYRSRINPKYCNNYLMLIEDAIKECEPDNRREVILTQTKGRDWLTVDEITELKDTRPDNIMR